MTVAYRRALLMLGAGVLVAGCSVFGTLKADTAIEPALLVVYRDSAYISVPDTVSHGVEFTVRLNTFTDTCTHSLARTELDVSGRVAEIRPFNWTKSIGGQGCGPADGQLILHTARIRVDEPGSFTIRAKGMWRAPGLGGNKIPVELSRVIAVR